MSDTENYNDPMQLTAEEQAYFDNGGQEPVQEAPAVEEYDPAEQVPEPDTATTEADEDDDGEDDAPEQGKRPGFVPHRKLHKAIEKAKKIEADLVAEREARVRLEERTNMILQRLQQPQQPAQPQQTEEPLPAPKAEEDIFGAVDHQGRRVETLEQRLARFEETERQNAQRQAVASATMAAEQVFARDNPDYLDAVNHLRTSRIAELQVFGYTEAQARQKVDQDNFNFVAQALQRNQNPAELTYRWAAQRGYAKRVEPAPEPAAEKLARQSDAQARSQTLSHGGGSPAPVKLDARTVAAMSEAQFMDLMEKHPKALEKLLRGE